MLKVSDANFYRSWRLKLTLLFVDVLTVCFRVFSSPPLSYKPFLLASFSGVYKTVLFFIFFNEEIWILKDAPLSVLLIQIRRAFSFLTLITSVSLFTIHPDLHRLEVLACHSHLFFEKVDLLWVQHFRLTELLLDLLFWRSSWIAFKLSILSVFYKVCKRFNMMRQLLFL